MDDSVWILNQTQGMRTMRNYFILQIFPESLPCAGHFSRGSGKGRVPSAHREQAPGLKTAGQAEGRADTCRNILTHPQTSATTAPQQINATTTQVQDVHDKKVMGPSREIQRYILRIAKELTKASEQPKPRLCKTSMQTLLGLTIEQMKLLFWKIKYTHFRKPLTWPLWKI